MLVGRAHATKSAHNVAQGKRLGKGAASRGPKEIGWGVGGSCVMAHIRPKLGLASENPHRRGGRGEARRGGRLRCRSLYHYMEVTMPVPGAEITHHVLVYRYRLFGFVRCRQNWGFGRPVAETIRVQVERCTCLARDVRNAPVPRIKKRPETDRPEGRTKITGKGKKGKEWGRKRRGVNVKSEQTLLTSPRRRRKAL